MLPTDRRDNVPYLSSVRRSSHSTIRVCLASFRIAPPYDLNLSYAEILRRFAGKAAEMAAAAMIKTFLSGAGILSDAYNLFAINLVRFCATSPKRNQRNRCCSDSLAPTLTYCR